MMKVRRKLCAGILSLVMLAGTATALPPEAFPQAAITAAAAGEKDPSVEYEFRTADGIYERLSDGTCRLINLYEHDVAKTFQLTLPSYATDNSTGEQLPVASIGYAALQNAMCIEHLSALTLPEHLTSIEKCALYGMKRLEKITIPGEGTLKIGELAFADNPLLTTITVKNKLLVEIGDEAFAYNVRLKSFDMSCVVQFTETSLGKGLFSHDESLTSITLPERFDIPEQMFYCCTGLEKVVFEYGASSVGEGAFSNCRRLKTVDFGAEHEVTFGKEAFAFCFALTELKVKENDTLGKYFDGDGIGNFAFKDCTSLKEFYYKTYARDLGNYAFEGCTALKEVGIKNACPGTLPLRFGTGMFRDSGIETFRLNDWINVSEEMFAGCSALTAIENVSSVATRGFANCTALSQLTIVSSAKDASPRNFLGELEQKAFSGCTSLREVTLAGYNVRVKKGAFDGSAVRVITVKGDDCEFLDSALEGNETLEYIRMTPDAIKTIGDRAFFGCTNLKQFTSAGADLTSTEPLPKVIFCALNAVGESAFEGCTSLDHVLFSIKFKTLGKRAFTGCTALSEVFLNTYGFESGSAVPKPGFNWFMTEIPDEASAAARACTRSTSTICPA